MMQLAYSMQAFTLSEAPDGILHLICTNPNKIAVKELATAIDHLCEYEDTTYLLVDFRDTGAFPIVPFSRRIDTMMERLHTNDNLRIALILRDDFLRDMAQQTLQTITNRDFVKYFTNKSDAEFWLNNEAV